MWGHTWGACHSLICGDSGGVCTTNYTHMRHTWGEARIHVGSYVGRMPLTDMWGQGRGAYHELHSHVSYVGTGLRRHVLTSPIPPCTQQDTLYPAGLEYAHGPLWPPRPPQPPNLHTPDAHQEAMDPLVGPANGQLSKDHRPLGVHRAVGDPARMHAQHVCMPDIRFLCCISPSGATGGHASGATGGHAQGLSVITQTCGRCKYVAGANMWQAQTCGRRKHVVT